jgi:sulfur carrier protein
VISVEINGEKRQVPEGLDVSGLLEWLQVDPQRVAVELNREIVRKSEWTEARVEDGAEVEVVMFVGGGK